MDLLRLVILIILFFLFIYGAIHCTFQFYINRLELEEGKNELHNLMVLISFTFSLALPCLLVPLYPIINALCHACLYHWSLKNAIPNIMPGEHIVVITGCDSGFGYAAALRLKVMGFSVVAGCLTELGLKKMKAAGIDVAVLCNVCNDQDVETLANATELFAVKWKKRVWAVVNNAGIAPMGFVDWLSMKSFNRAMDVNYFGK
jgi:hypothetical protein